MATKIELIDDTNRSEVRYSIFFDGGSHLGTTVKKPESFGDDRHGEYVLAGALASLKSAAGLDAAAKAIWDSESHPILSAAGHATDYESQPMTIKKSLRRKARLAIDAALGGAGYAVR